MTDDRDEEITGVHELPMVVRPWAVSMGERHKQLRKDVNMLTPKVDMLHMNMQTALTILKLIAWGIGILAVIGGGHLVASWHH